MDNATFPSADEQQRILNDASVAVKRNAFLMRKAIDEDNMRDALKHASGMLAELRTSQLQPQKYYELYMQVFDQLAYLEAFFAEERGKGRSYGELYELVQHAGNVLPRLYLMVAVGCLYIKSHEASPQEVLKDLVEMCKGVQHPTRGLFLRAYLCQRARALLPDTGSEFEGPGSGSIHDALDFLMTNFIEMNKLWVRLQHQGSARDKEKRERERQQLADLVGKNLTYLSQLDGLSFELYAGQVLPRVLDQITSCRDDLAQLYLMQALIQGFPDRFHLGTLEALLAVLPQLQPGVKVHSVMAALMDRLARYAAAASGAAGGGAVGDPRLLQELAAMDAFRKFKDAIGQIIASQPNLAAADAVEMYVALLSYAGSVHPGILSYVDEVLAAAAAALGGRGVGLGGDVRAERQLVALLGVPLAKYGVNAALELQQYPPLTRLLRYSTHKELAVKIVQRVLEPTPAAGAAAKAAAAGSAAVAGGSTTGAAGAGGSAAGAAGVGSGGGGGGGGGATGGCVISSVEKVGMLFRFISPLVADPEAAEEVGGAREMDDEDLAEEQVLVARLLHHLSSPDPDTHFALLTTAHSHLLAGGPRRLRTTLPALLFAGLGLNRRLVGSGAGKAGGAGGKGKKEKEGEGATAGGEAAAGGKEGEEEKSEGEQSKGEETEAAEVAAGAPAAEVPVVPKLTSETLLRFLLSAVEPLTGGPAAQPLTALRLLLALGHVASEEARLELLAYTCYEEALALYDEALPDQRTRAAALYDIIGSLQRCRVFGPAHRGPLAAAASAAAMALVGRSQQCAALCAAAHLWWQAGKKGPGAGGSGEEAAAGKEEKEVEEKDEDGEGAGGVYPPVRDAAKVVSVLQRAGRVAGRARQQYRAAGWRRDGAYMAAHIEVLDAWLRFWDSGLPVSATPEGAVQALIDAVQDDLAAGVTPAPAVARRWASSLAHMAARAAAPEGRETYGKLKLPAAA